MADAELIRGDGLTLVPVPAGASLDALDELTGGRAAGRGWPHADTAAGLSFLGSGGWTWLIVDADAQVVGECGTKTPPWAGTVEIGYGLAAPSRGRGLGGRAVQALTRWLGARPDVERVIAHVAEDNVASRRLLERLDFEIDRVEGGEVIYVRNLSGEPSSSTGKVDLSNDDDT
jgi:GNAT superfamily N-acetyltransferase